MKWTRLLLALVFFGVCPMVGCVVPLKVPPIQPGTAEKPKIDFGRLAEFANAAGHAYSSASEIEKAYGKENVVVRSLPGSDGSYFILFNHAERIQTISIRGTANKLNAQVDMESIKVIDSRLGIFIRSGFKRASEELYQDVRPFLQADYKTRITGHSLGGALACLLMMNLMRDAFPVEQVLTFGQPKITNEAGAVTYQNPNYYRIINGRDLVAQVPPSNLVYDLSGPYQHFGPEIILQGDGTWTYSPVHIPTDFITNDNWKELNFENGTDHQVANYIERIRHIRK